MNGKITYRQQYTRCGKERCRKCREGTGHGPYWYAYWSEKGRTVSKYIGITLPEHIEMELSRQHSDEQGVQRSSAMPHTAIPTLRVYLLGQFRVEHWQSSSNEWRAVDSRTWHRRRARALLGCLLSGSGRRVGREQVMEQLWPDLDSDIAANRLNGAVHELRQILEPDIARPAASRMLRLERDILELADNTQIWVDAEEFENLLKKAELTSDADQAEHILEQAAHLYKGQYLLEELYSEWAAPRRDALQRAWVGLQLKLADLRAEQGASVSAIETLDRLRTADPTNETALQRLMILLTQLDRRGEALQIYRQHEAMLEREYEGDPLPETAELYEALRKGHVPTLYTFKIPSRRVQETPSKPLEVARPRETRSQDLPLMRPVFQLGRHNQSPLIGRERELETMQQLLLSIEDVKTSLESNEVANTTTPYHAGGSAIASLTATASIASRTPHTHFLLLRGEAGIGKTRLAEELSLAAYHRSWIVAWSRSYEQERTIPYRPWTEMLRTLLHSTSTDPHAIATRLGISEPSLLKLDRLSALVPELASAPPTTPLPSLPHEQERLHMWEATLSLLTAFSRLHPLLLVFDDLHWVDDSSIELLTYLTHHLQDQPILLIGTCRDGELAPQHKLRTLTVDLQREQAIALVGVQPLTRSQIGTLLSHLPQDVVQSIQMQASGNPFFAEELGRYIASTSDDDGSLALTLNNVNKQMSQATAGEYPPTAPDRSLPEGIAAVLERRLNRLSSGCQALLGRAAVLGGSFELSQLRPMATEYSEDTVLDLLEEALHAGLLTEEGTGAHITYHFWHPLIISHLYGRLSAARRAQLHRKAAEAIKTANLAQPEKVAAAIFHHLSKGGTEQTTVAYYAELAGNHAFLLAAYSEAQQFYLHAIQALIPPGTSENGRDGQDTHTRIQRITEQALAQLAIGDPLRVCRLLERVAECSIIMGNFEEGRHLYESALTLRSSEHFQHQVYTARPPTGAQLQREAQIQGLHWREIGITWSSIGEYSQAYASYSHGKEVMAHVGVTSGAAWACLHLQYGATLRIEGNYHEAHRYLQEALTTLEEVVQQQQDQGQEETAEVAPGTGLLATSARENAQPLPSRELPTRTERALMGDRLEIGYAHERLGIVAASLGQLNDALIHLQTALAIYEQSELVSVMARVCGNLGAVYITRGEHAEARDYMHRALSLAERAGNIPSMAFVMHNLGDVAQRSGALQEAAEWFTRSLAHSKRLNDREHMSWCHVALAAVQDDLGDFSEAAANLFRGINIARAIKSTRCLCYALVGMAGLRISQGLMELRELQEGDEQSVGERTNSRSHRLFWRARKTLQRAISLAGMEVENIIDGKHHLATVHFLLGDLATAREMTQQVLKESQEHETTRVTGRAYRLLGRILAAQGELTLAIHFFQQALQICRERDLRLEYARALHSYGAALLYRAHPLLSPLSPPPTDPSPDRPLLPEQQYQEGLAYLQQAQAIFEECGATPDLAFVAQLLVQVETLQKATPSS
jgi:tetratricopeptide (TPR) repeat protein